MKTSDLMRFIVATGVSVVLTAVFTWYSTARIGVFSLSVLNKSLADTSLTLLAMVLLLGPLSRLYDLFDEWLPYRKEFGISSFLLGAVHLYLVMFPLARRGPFGFFVARPTEAYTGLAGLMVMLFLFIISFEFIKKMLGIKQWWRLQYAGARIAGIAVLLHLSVLKYPEWTKWLSGKATNLAIPSFPPANLLVGLFGGFVLLVRLSEFFGAKVAKKVVPLFFFAALAMTGLFFLR